MLAVSGGLVFGAGLQQRRPRWNPFMAPPPRIMPTMPYDGNFRFCRGSFNTTPEGDGDGWYVDYPLSDENLSTRLSEITKTRVSQDLEGVPVHMVLPFSDPAL